MPSLSPIEILVVVVVALIVFGPERLPEMARKVGRATNELRRMAADVKSEFDTSLAVDDEPDEPGPARKRRFDLDDTDEPPLARALEDDDPPDEPPLARALGDDDEVHRDPEDGQVEQ